MEWYWYLLIFLCIIIIARVYVKLTLKKCTSKNRLDGKTVIITGANSGIGKETAKDLAIRGARIIMACRNLETAEQVRNDIVASTGNENIVIRHLDLTSLASVREFCAKINKTESRLDVLINNAGASGLGNNFTSDGLYIGMQVNHLGPFLLTMLLIDLLKKSAPSRIVNVASLAHITAWLNASDLNKPVYFDVVNYSNTKLCNIYMTTELARRLGDSGITVNCLHPGAVDTGLFRNAKWWLKPLLSIYVYFFFLTPEEGAQTTIYLTVADEVKNVTGKNFQDCRQRNPSKTARDQALAVKVWEQSESLVKLRPEEKSI